MFPFSSKSGSQPSRTWSKVVDEIINRQESLAEKNDAEISDLARALKFRARSGETIEQLIVDAYSIIREASWRRLGMRHFPVQLLGGVALAHGNIAEMQTGEGKTLTALLPSYLYALYGQGSHVVTVNDYLAERDCEMASEVFDMLGMSCGVVLSSHSPNERGPAYKCDITYAQGKELGFDYLRDKISLFEQLERRQDRSRTTWDDATPLLCERQRFFALVDEADSVMLDEAGTPLIIGIDGGPADEETTVRYQWAARYVPQLELDTDFFYDKDNKAYELTRKGRHRIRTSHRPPAVNQLSLFEIYEMIERSIRVNRDFSLNDDYVIQEDEIVIVDRNTGRLGDGRKWQQGIHQAIEAKENITVSGLGGQAARVTIQQLFLKYKNLAGMTGTAYSARREIDKVFQLKVHKIPTNKPCMRQGRPTLTFPTELEKFRAIVAETKELNAAQRPVLIGTRAIEKSLAISELLAEEGIEHKVLNALHTEEEAELVSDAGQLGQVIVATSMAGRGTDIKLGEGVAEIGGLHVICTEKHDSARIDRQLVGRAGRQGDPGSYRFFLSTEDEIFELEADDPVRAQKGLHVRPGATLSERRFDAAQKKVEVRNQRDRHTMLAIEKERAKTLIEMGMDANLVLAD